ncbi:MAG: hypothetical protein HY040_05040 [Planctomycetes bacterium]|nr:hypothetical protein [Planctomycetota bacterium]
MSVAPALPISSLSENIAWRLFVRAVTAAGAIVGVSCTIYLIEKYAVVPRRRFVENPVEIMMRAFGIAHFVIGWLFLATSPRLQDRRAILQLAGWIGCGLVLCSLFAIGGGSKNLLLLIAFYSLFLIHDSGDQVRLFQGQSSQNKCTLGALRWLFVLLSITILTGSFLFTGYWLKKNPSLQDLSPYFPQAAWCVLAAATLIAGLRFVRLVRNECGLDAFLQANSPLLAIFVSLLGILTIGSFFGTLGLNIIILLHVTTWLVHVHHKLGESPGAHANVWTWMRRTPSGFLSLHLGLAAAFVAILAMRVQVWERSGWFCSALSATSFPYWSMLHIATAFWRGR